VKNSLAAAVARGAAPPVERPVAGLAESSASTRRLSPPWGEPEKRSPYDLPILYREHSEEHKIKKILPQRFYVFLPIFYTKISIYNFLNFDNKVECD